ncbi:MAG TPA: aldo/keto reductase [Myxococcales bacterium LLY-WYZ-16_1]|nr:aldo/keto reductase [Myxococcales bacterium LLY-WYZ-16_1]
MKTIELFDGTPVPALGLGTWKSKKGEVADAVRAALDMGYRHLDCAAIYGNEAEVGEALSGRLDGIRREDLWVTSKLWNDAHHPDDVRPALEKTLGDLKLDQLDLYLMHWPVALRKGVPFPRSREDFVSLEEIPLEKTWEAMLRCREDGLVRHVGVSNFSVKKVKQLADAFSEPVAMNQVELHPYLQQSDLVRSCRQMQTAVTAYSPLGTPDSASLFGRNDDQPLLSHPTILEIAERLRGTPGQVLIAWALARGTLVIPKSTKPHRIRENLEAADLRLEREDLEAISGLDRHMRLVDGSFWCNDSPYTWEGLWDEGT